MVEGKRGFMMILWVVEKGPTVGYATAAINESVVEAVEKASMKLVTRLILLLALAVVDVLRLILVLVVITFD